MWSIVAPSPPSDWCGSSVVVIGTSSGWARTQLVIRSSAATLMPWGIEAATASVIWWRVHVESTWVIAAAIRTMNDRPDRLSSLSAGR